MTFGREAIVPLIAMVFVALYVTSTRGLPDESQVFPYTVMTVLVILGAAVLFAEWRLKDGTGKPAKPAVKSRATFVFLMSVGFVAALVWVNFIVASFVFLVVAFLVLRGRPVSSAIIAAGYTGALYLLFAVGLHVPL